MTIRRDLLLGLGALVVLQLVTSFSAIGVLTRTAPAVRGVLDANVLSLAAGEEVLRILLASPASEVDRASAEAALVVLRGNLTESGEEEIVGEVASRLPGALEGDAGDEAAVAAALRRLSHLNREAMRRADAEMQRLGSAGAWFSVATAAGAFLLSLLIGRRLQRRLLAPLQELTRVLDAARSGRGQRRCQPIPAAPDVRRLLEDLNGLLDARLDHTGEDEAGRAAERAALLHVLDEGGATAFVVDRTGRVTAASRAGLSALAAAGGEALREQLAALAERAADEPPPTGAVALGEAGWLLTGEPAARPASG